MNNMETNYPQQPQKKHGFLSGCLGIGGGVLTVVGLLMVVFGVFLTYICIDGVDSKRAESDARWAEYVADSAYINSQYRKFEQLQAEAYERGDSLAMAELEDSLAMYQEPELFHGGENIGAAFGIAFIVIGLVPLAIGIVMLVIAYMNSKKTQ